MNSQQSHFTKVKETFLLAVINEPTIIGADLSIPERKINVFTKVA